MPKKDKLSGIVACRKQCFLHDRDGENVPYSRGDSYTTDEEAFHRLLRLGQIVLEGSEEADKILGSVKKPVGRPKKKAAATSSDEG